MAELSKAGRNDPCPCGSGKKYKRCCLTQTDARVEDDSPVRPDVPGVRKRLGPSP